jgi:DNA recombination protein RmuC
VLDLANARVAALSVQLTEVNAGLAREQERNRHLEQTLAGRKEELERLQQQLTRDFENLANRILEEKSARFTEQNRTNLDIILNPLKERIKDFESKVEKAYASESAERNSLKGQIISLMELNKKISEEASNLTTALKGDTKQQGNWGELVLERILESSGLLSGEEYDLQVASSNQDGDRIILDAVIRLPDDKQIIIDSKVSLLAYQSLVSSTDPEETERHRKAHLVSIRNHIKTLSGKNYQTARGFFTPDFVLMFVPIESSFGVAVQADRELFNYAWDRKIVLVSPSTLLATLRTIASLWKQERQTQNALQIAEEGGKLYDKFVGFVEDLLSVGKRLDDAKGQYSEAMKKLVDGSGNLVRRAEKMKDLGAKASKSLPPALLERAENQSAG